MVILLQNKNNPLFKESKFKRFKNLILISLKMNKHKVKK